MANKFETAMVNAEDIRDTTTRTSGAAVFGKIGFGVGILVIENDLNQDVTIQLQGKPDDGNNWQDIGSTVGVTASSQDNVFIGVPWSLLRVTYAADTTPTGGDLTVFLNIGKSGFDPASVQDPRNPTIDSYSSAVINAAAAANQVLVAAPGENKQIWVYGLFMMADTDAGTVTLQDENDTALSGTMAVSDEGGWVLPISGDFAMPWIKVATNKALEADCATSTIDGILCYGIISV